MTIIKISVPSLYGEKATTAIRRTRRNNTQRMIIINHDHHKNQRSFSLWLKGNHGDTAYTAEQHSKNNHNQS
jgi:hypothetical protein